MNAQETRDAGDPTQTAPETSEEMLLKLQSDGAWLVDRFETVAKQVQKDIDSLAIIARTMQNCVRRMEILKQTLRPLPPIPDKDDDRLCAGELKIIAELRLGVAQTLTELANRTGYAQSSIRTWLPMLRAKGIVQHDRLELVETVSKELTGSPA